MHACALYGASVMTSTVIGVAHAQGVSERNKLTRCNNYFGIDNYNSFRINGDI